LVELDLFVLSFIQNYDLLKCYSINLKNTVKNVSGSNRQKKIRTFSSDSASAKKFDVLIKKKECIERLQLSQEWNDCNQFLQRTFRIRTFSSGSASAKKFDVLIKNKECIERLQPLKSPMTAISFYSALLELEHSVPVQPQLKNLTFL